MRDKLLELATRAGAPALAAIRVSLGMQEEASAFSADTAKAALDGVLYAVAAAHAATT
jgi:hypothetical protein